MPYLTLSTQEVADLSFAFGAFFHEFDLHGVGQTFEVELTEDGMIVVNMWAHTLAELTVFWSN